MDFLCQFSGMKPARTVITRSPSRTVGAIHATWIQPGAIHHESDLEADSIRLLLLAPSVRRIEHQAQKIKYFDGIAERTHIPDLRITCDRAHCFVEVKPARFVDKHLLKFDACAALLRSSGIDYFVCTEEHIRERGERALTLLGLAKRLAPSDALSSLVAWVRDKRRVDVEEALAAGYSEDLIGHAVGRRLVITDPSLLLAPGNWLSTQETADELPSIEQWLGCSPWPPRPRDTSKA